MHCPRCGQSNERGARFCISCGHDLRPRPERGEGGARGLIARIVGSSRRERILTGATVAAVGVAIAAFIALDPAGDEGPADDPFTAASDERCVRAKREITRAAERSLRGGGPGLEAYARRLLATTLAWREDQRALEPPGGRRADAERLESALLDVTVALSALARAARSGDEGKVTAAAANADEATASLEGAIEEAGLSRCDRLTFVLRPAPGGG